MLGGAQTLLNDGQNRRQVAANQGGRVEPQAREDRTVNKPSADGGQGHVSPLLQHEPIDLPFENAINDVFADAVATKSIELVVQIVTGTARGDLGDQVRTALNIAIVVDLDAASMFRLDEEKGVRLRRVVDVEENGAVVAPLDARRSRPRN